jgi:hypothetical protein
MICGVPVDRVGPVLLLLVAAVLFAVPSVEAQESPYFVTYDHYLEEPGSLDVEFNPVYATQRGGNDFIAATTELEYGITAWWTTELYLDGQTTFNDSTLFTGFRWENRFRPLAREHAINPILYIEYESVSEADKVMKEIEGHDVEADHGEPNADLSAEHNHELELKLILSSTVKGWNISENILAVKNLSGEPWEFGYAFGVSRPLALKASPERCTFCRENFIAGAEVYGGLGDTEQFGFTDTSHYVAPLIGWNLPSGLTLRLSPGWGLNDDSHRFLLRFGVSYEFSHLGGR